MQTPSDTWNVPIKILKEQIVNSKSSGMANQILNTLSSARLKKSEIIKNIFGLKPCVKRLVEQSKWFYEQDGKFYSNNSGLIAIALPIGITFSIIIVLLLVLLVKYRSINQTSEHEKVRSQYAMKEISHSKTPIKPSAPYNQESVSFENSSKMTQSKIFLNASLSNSKNILDNTNSMIDTLGNLPVNLKQFSNNSSVHSTPIFNPNFNEFNNTTKLNKLDMNSVDDLSKKFDLFKINAASCNCIKGCIINCPCKKAKQLCNSACHLYRVCTNKN